MANIKSDFSAPLVELEEKLIDVLGMLYNKADELRAQSPVNWLPYLEAQVITEEQYNFLSTFQIARTKEERTRILEENKETAASTFLLVVRRIWVVQEVQKFLVLFYDMLKEEDRRVFMFWPMESEPWKAFLDLLSASDGFVCNMSSRIITRFIIDLETKPKESDIQFFLTWLNNQLRLDNEYLLCVGRCLQQILRVDEFRSVFVNLRGIFRIIRLLHAGVIPQAQYQLVFCVWVASYNVEVAEKVTVCRAIHVLTELLQSCCSENTKLPRVIMATFRNILEKPRDDVQKRHALILVQCKMLRLIELLRNRNKLMDDPEFVEDFNVIELILNKCVTQLSTFDVYKIEVKSGHLEWSIVHTSTPFWKENAHRLNDNHYELLTALISLLESVDSTVLCVAAHDLGEYMKWYPRGKKLVTELRGKDALLKLLSHGSDKVKYHALKSLQILMLNNSDFMGVSTDRRMISLDQILSSRRDMRYFNTK